MHKSLAQMPVYGPGRFQIFKGPGGIECQASPSQYTCNKCSFIAKSSAALITHFKKHGAINPLRKIEGPVCPCCLRFYGNRQKCLQHVSRSRCGLYVETLQDLDEDVFVAVEAEMGVHRHQLSKSGQRRYLAEEVAYQSQGPLAFAAAAILG